MEVEQENRIYLEVEKKKDKKRGEYGRRIAVKKFRENYNGKTREGNEKKVEWK